MDFPTRTDLRRVMRDRILGLNALLSAEAVDRTGSDADVFLAGVSAMGDEVIAQLIRVARARFLDSAEGADLELLVFDEYGLLKKPAAPSRGVVRFYCTVATTSAFPIPAGTLVATADGVQFVTTSASSFPLGSVGPIFVPVRSVLAGQQQQAKAGAITTVVSSIALAPGSFAVANDYATAGAADVESDESLRDRARRFWTTAQKGTLAAIEAGALAVAGIDTASAIEVLDSSGRAGRWVQLLVADRFTNALVSLNATSPAYDAQSQQLAQTVFQALSDVRCGGMFVQVIVARVVLLPISLNLTFSSDTDPLSTSESARAVVSNLVSALAPGQAFSPSDAVAALRSVSGLVVTGKEIALPSGPVVPRAMQVLRTTIDLVTATNQGANIYASVNPDFLISL